MLSGWGNHPRYGTRETLFQHKAHDNFHLLELTANESHYSAIFYAQHQQSRILFLMLPSDLHIEYSVVKKKRLLDTPCSLSRVFLSSVVKTDSKRSKSQLNCLQYERKISLEKPEDSYGILAPYQVILQKSQNTQRNVHENVLPNLVGINVLFL